MQQIKRENAAVVVVCHLLAASCTRIKAGILQCRSCEAEGVRDREIDSRDDERHKTETDSHAHAEDDADEAKGVWSNDLVGRSSVYRTLEIKLGDGDGGRSLGERQQR